MAKNYPYDYDNPSSVRESRPSSFSTFPPADANWLDDHRSPLFPRQNSPEHEYRTDRGLPVEQNTALTFARQEEIDHRENQLNARIAQFETLVRNTKLSHQTKLAEVAQREKLLEGAEEKIQAQRLTHEERMRGEVAELEHQHRELQARKAEIEDRLVRRERELQELAAEREKEVSARADEYRGQLEERLLECRTDYQQRYENKCREIEAEFVQRLDEEKTALEASQRKGEEDFAARIALLNREVEAKKEEFERRFVSRYEELERQFAGRRQELEDSLERRVKRIEEEYAQKKAETDSRLDRRDEQIRQRETILRQGEDDWNRRREAFESQWNEFEQLRKAKMDELGRREAKLEEREHYFAEFEAKLKRKEVEQATFDESLKSRESKASVDAQKYANLQQMQTDVLEQQAEAGRIREGLVRERHQLQKTIEAERKRLRETQELALRRLEDERQDLAQQNKRMEQMRLAMDRSREELGRMHRETLEIRLATEELWLRLSGDSASEDLKESIGRIRTRLAEQYHEAMARLESQKVELKETRDQMLQQHEKMLARREELESWTARNEEVLANRERQLKEREQELDQRQSVLDEAARRHRDERTEMQKEIRLLQEQIDRAFETKRVA